MTLVLSCVFNLELFSFLVCSSTGQGGDKAGWHLGDKLALLLSVRGL